LSGPDLHAPPKVGQWDKESGGRVSPSINRRFAGPTHEKELPVGQTSFSSSFNSRARPMASRFHHLVSRNSCPPAMQAPNMTPGLINIGEGEAFSSALCVNPQFQDPGLDGPQHDPADPHLRIPRDADLSGRKFRPPSCRQKTPSAPNRSAGLMWQDRAAPLLGGGFGHFLAYAPENTTDQPLCHGSEAPARRARPSAQDNEILPAPITDLQTWRIMPWYGALVHRARSRLPASFLQVQDYKNVIRWMKQVRAPPLQSNAAKMVTAPSQAGIAIARNATMQRLRHQGRRTSSEAAEQPPGPLSSYGREEGHSTRTCPMTRPTERRHVPDLSLTLFRPYRRVSSSLFPGGIVAVAQGHGSVRRHSCSPSCPPFGGGRCAT